MHHLSYGIASLKPLFFSICPQSCSPCVPIALKRDISNLGSLFLAFPESLEHCASASRIDAGTFFRPPSRRNPTLRFHAGTKPSASWTGRAPCAPFNPNPGLTPDSTAARFVSLQRVQREHSGSLHWSITSRTPARRRMNERRSGTSPNGKFVNPTLQATGHLRVHAPDQPSARVQLSSTSSHYSPLPPTNSSHPVTRP